jgi:hypothetical protein
MTLHKSLLVRHNDGVLRGHDHASQSYRVFEALQVNHNHSWASYHFYSLRIPLSWICFSVIVRFVEDSTVNGNIEKTISHNTSAE